MSDCSTSTGNSLNRSRTLNRLQSIDSVFVPNQVGDKGSWIEDPKAWDYFCSLLTSLYGLFLIVFAIVMELSQKLVPDGWLIEMLFYSFMYGTGIVFLAYFYLFQIYPQWFNALMRIAQRKKWINSLSSREPLNHGEGNGSLYLRLGTLFFGTAGIVLFCLEIFVCVSNRCCAYKVGNWILASFFTFIQMHFIFCNSKIVISESKNLVKLGTMHLLAVNIWTWLRFVIAKQEGKSLFVEHSAKSSNRSDYQLLSINSTSLLTSMTTVSSFGYFGDFATLLTTCIVEYSVISAAIMFVLWRSIDEHVLDPQHLTCSKRKHKVRIDCSASNAGLFAGILFFICSLVSIGIYTIFSQHADDNAALLVFRLSDFILFCFTLIGSMIGLYRMRILHYHKRTYSTNAEFLDEILLMIGMCILTKAQLSSVQKTCEAEKGGQEGVKLGKEAIKHIKLMIEVKPAQAFIDDKFCNVAKYTSLTLFQVVQYRNYVKINGKGSLMTKPTFDKNICLRAWKVLDNKTKKKWQTEAKIIKEQAVANEEAGTSVDKPVFDSKRLKIFIIWCPGCMQSFYSTEFNKHLNVHFPDSFGENVDKDQEKQRSDFELVLKRKPTTYLEWNSEIKAFSQYLSGDRKDLELNKEITSYKKLIVELKESTGNFSVYSQVQDPTGQFECAQDSLTEVHHYVGRFNNTLRYLNETLMGSGRVGYEHKLAVEKQVPLYFFIIFENLSKESADCIEHCKMLALFHLDHGLKNEDDLSNVWNVNITSLPKNHKFYSLDLKVLIKVGILLWYETVDKFNNAVQDKTFYDSKELLVYYNPLSTAEQKSFKERCGNYEPRRDDSGKRTAKKRKRGASPTRDDSDATFTSHNLTVLEFAQQLHSAISSGQTTDQTLAFLANFIDKSNLDEASVDSSMTSNDTSYKQEDDEPEEEEDAIVTSYKQEVNRFTRSAPLPVEKRSLLTNDSDGEVSDDDNELPGGDLDISFMAFKAKRSKHG